jgi:hypothetical protein
MALSSAKKSAVSDALKRSLRHLGHQLGLSIYDREHVKLMKINSKKKQDSSMIVERKTNPIFLETEKYEIKENLKIEKEEEIKIESKTPLIPVVKLEKNILIPVTSPPKIENKISNPLIPVTNSPKNIQENKNEKSPLIPVTLNPNSIIPVTSSPPKIENKMNPIIPVNKKKEESGEENKLLIPIGEKRDRPTSNLVQNSQPLKKIKIN